MSQPPVPPIVAAAPAAPVAAVTPQPPIVLGELEILQLPDRLQILARTVIISGTVQQRAELAAQLVALRTEAGDVLVRALAGQSLPQLPPERLIYLQIAPGNPPRQAIALTDGPPAASARPGPASDKKIGGSSAPSATSPQPAPLNSAVPPAAVAAPTAWLGQAFGAVVLPQFLVAPAGLNIFSPPAITATLQPPGTALSATTTGSGSPTASPRPTGLLAEVKNWLTSGLGPATQPSPLPGANTAAAAPAPRTDFTSSGAAPAASSPSVGPAPAAPGASTTTQIAAPARLEAGQFINLRVLAFHNPPAAASQTDNIIAATVISNGPQGQPILQTEAGNTLLLRSGQPLPPGTRLWLAASSPNPLPSSGEQIGAAPPRDLASLRTVLEWLQATDPTLQRTVMQRLPTLGPQLGSGLLFLMSALRLGDPAALLGERATAALRQAGRTNLLNALQDELRGLRQNLSESAAAADWRSLNLPVQQEGQVLFIPLFLHAFGKRDETDADRPTSANRGTRFVIEVALSRLGQIQLDGLSQARRLDIIVRSEQLLGETLTRNLRTRYLELLEEIRLTGTLSFQPGRSGFVRLPTGQSASSS